MNIIEEAKNYIDSYISPYVLSKETTESQVYKLKMRHAHMYRVGELSKDLAISLGMPEADIEMAHLIGIMHDVGRIKQIVEFDTFEDTQSFDHGDLGRDIIKELDFITSYYDENNLNLIQVAIENHNKFYISEDVKDERILTFCKLIRDADKIDIFNIVTKGEEFERRKSFLKPGQELNPKILERVKMHKSADNRDRKNATDEAVHAMTWAFDVYYPESIAIIKEKGYIKVIFDTLNEVGDFKFLEEYFSKLL